MTYTGPKITALTAYSPIEMLSFSTTLITSVCSDGQTATGTGFYFELYRGHPTGKSLSLLVTNRHVIEDSDGGNFRVTLLGDDGLPSVGNYIEVPLPPRSAPIGWRHHPDVDVDLAALPIGSMLGHAWKSQVFPFIASIIPEHMPSVTDLDLMAQLDPLAMPGYPQGFWDSFNNQPIFRKGALATHPALPFEGRREFLADIECQPGSSGSPVFVYNPGEWTDKWGAKQEKRRLLFVGVLYAGYLQSADGEIRAVPIPTTTSAIASMQIPMGLALCISSDRLLEFANVFPPPPEGLA